VTTGSGGAQRPTARRPPSGYVALVLHAHLPYVRHPEHARSLEERWLFEALWETYLPLVDMLDRLAGEGVDAPISISVSPPLAAMLGDALLRERYLDHVRRTRAIASHSLGRAPGGPLAAAIAHHLGLLDRAAATFERHGGDVLGALVSHHREGRIFLFTTAATHAFLPGLLSSSSRAWARAQIELGPRAFEAMTGVRPAGLWLPECAFAPALDALLGAASMALTVLDAHGIALAEPRPEVATIGHGDDARVVPTAPLRSAAGVTYFGRDMWAGRSVWAMDGYPSHPAYRELHRDLGFDLDEEELLGEVGPSGVRVATGIKPYRITGAAQKAPYDPAAARRLAAAHALSFVDDRGRLFDVLPRRGAPPLSVAPFDAELFGHFWHEGPIFLEEVLRRLARTATAGGPAAITLMEYMERFPTRLRGSPAASTWGEGGFGAAWTGPRTAALWRHVHHASADVLTAARAAPDATGPRGEALDQAIVEALLLQSSDFAFMIHQGTTAEYAARRTAEHAANASRLAHVARSGAVGPEDTVWIREVRDRAPLFRDLPTDVLRAALLAPGS
jgi:1,4-alpha-glucan branching enzyme